MGPRSPLRFGRCRTDVPRTSCNPSSARLRLLRGRRPWFKVSPPARSARGMRSPGPHSVSAPLRSAQSRHPPDVLRPIFRMATVVVWQALPMGPMSPLRFGRRRTDIPRFKGSASILAGIFRLLLIEMQFFSGLVRNVFLMAGLEDGNKYPVPILPEVNPRWLDKTPVHF